MEIIINPFEFEINCDGIHQSEASYYLTQLANCEEAAKDVLSGKINIDDYLDRLEMAELDIDEFLAPIIYADN